MDYRQLEQIDNYHSGRMTPEEVIAFEKELATNPELKAESDLQREVVNGLKEFRKTQLKARLDAIDVTPSWIEFAQQSTLMKSFGGVAVATLIGAGIYFNAERIETPSMDNDIVIDAPNYESPDFVWSLGEEDKNEIVTLDPLPEKKKEIPLSKPVEEKTPQTMTNVVAEEVKTEKKEFTPDFNAPNAKSIQDEEALKTASLDELPQKQAVAVNNDPIDVKTEITKSLDVKYKYYDGKLFLTGDFDRAPYEILEINSASGRRIYVKYLDKYYQVGVTDQLTALPEVTDTAVIEELKLLRQNK